ncbi:MAG: toll/interleukin-1 receptor domain-containing protein [Clostridia bacterium]|nr:toll/interleukin-1 receptor domain-containing protein [Clostridia bacterium]
MLDLKKLIDEMQLARSKVFVSLSSTNKAEGVRLVRQLSRMKIDHWCMYDENGRDINISGVVYPETISAAIAHTCVFIYLISQRSLSSGEVEAELRQIAPAVRAGDAKVLPIFVDGTESSGIPKKITDLIGVDSHTIIRRFGASGDEEGMELICNEIMDQYLTTVFDGIKKKIEKQKNSHILTALMNACVSKECTANFISDDIKETTETSSDSLQEMHILSNEIMEYDCNTYSCMIIASNLLGDEEEIGGKRVFRPEKNGVKYFYYTPASAEEDSSPLEKPFEIIKDFIRKSESSRRQVTSLIRREFSVRNKVVTFFREFNNMTLRDFMEQYHVETGRDSEEFRQLFGSEAAQSYFAYSDEDDVFSVPDEFIAWISGDNRDHPYAAMREVSYAFIDFLRSFVDFLERAEDINKVSLKLLKKRCTYLERFRELEEWQIGNKPNMPASQAKQLVTYLLNYTADTDFRGEKRFPRLASWMHIYYDENGKVVQIDEKTIEKALDNLVCVPIVDDDETLKLCYSFAIFLGKAEASGVWYTTGVSGLVGDRTINEDDEKESMVTTYEFDKLSEEYGMLLDAWAYMLAVSPKAKEVLAKHGSDLLRVLRENKKRGTHK